jgi:hypothetical protein
MIFTAASSRPKMAAENVELVGEVCPKRPQIAGAVRTRRRSDSFKPRLPQIRPAWKDQDGRTSDSRHRCRAAAWPRTQQERKDPPARCAPRRRPCSLASAVFRGSALGDEFGGQSFTRDKSIRCMRRGSPRALAVGGIADGHSFSGETFCL